MAKIKDLKSVLVTGGAGFIGSNLVERLVVEGVSVTVIDNFSTGKRENIKSIKNKIKLIEGDICDEKVLKKAIHLKETRVIFHIAAIPSVPRSIKFPSETNRVNVEGTVKLLQSAVNAKVKRVVFISSSSVYGDTPTLPKREDMPPNPLSPYAVSKLGGELYSKVFSLNFGIEVVCIRLFNVYGPRQDPNSQYAAVIPIFIKSLLSGSAPPIYGDGNQTRDFTFVHDTVEGLILAGLAKGNVAGEIINIAGGGRTSINSLAETLAQIIGITNKPAYLSPREGDILHSYADITKARKLLGYTPKISLEEGLKATVYWYKRSKGIN